MCVPLDFEIDEKIIQQISGNTQNKNKPNLKPVDFDLDENIIKKITSNSGFVERTSKSKQKQKQKQHVVVRDSRTNSSKESNSFILTKNELNFTNDYLSHEALGPIIVTYWNFQE